MSVSATGFFFVIKRVETTASLRALQCVVPEWMHDVFLGYGDPDSAHYRSQRFA